MEVCSERGKMVLKKDTEAEPDMDTWGYITNKRLVGLSVINPLTADESGIYVYAIKD